MTQTTTVGSTHELATIWILSGEGEVGTRERYTGKLSARALKARLTRERCGGDRWAHLECETAARHPERVSPEDAIAMMSAAGEVTS
jgi:hypothetical protein